MDGAREAAHGDLVTVAATAWVGPRRRTLHLSDGPDAPGCAGHAARPAAVEEVDIWVDRTRPPIIVEATLEMGRLMALVRLARVLDPARLCRICSSAYVLPEQRSDT